MEREPRFFGIEDKITKLDEIIKKVLDRMKTLSEDNKDYYINTIKIKQNHLSQIYLNNTKKNTIILNF